MADSHPEQVPELSPEPVTNPTNPRIAIANLRERVSVTEQKHEKAARGRKYSLGAIAVVLGLVSGAFVWVLGEARSRAEVVAEVRIVPVVKDIEVLEAWVRVHEAAQIETQKETTRQLERTNDKLDAVLVRFNIPQPPPRAEKADGGAP